MLDAGDLNSEMADLVLNNMSQQFAWQSIYQQIAIRTDMNIEMRLEADAFTTNVTHTSF